MDVENEVAPQLTGNIWDIGNPDYFIDNTIVDREPMEYPFDGASTQTNFNLYNTDVNSYIFLPSLKVEVDFQIKNSGNALTVANQTALASNGWLLFQNAQLRLGGDILETVNNPGYIDGCRSTVLYSYQYMDRVGPSQHKFVDLVSDAHATTTTTRDISIYAGADNSGGAAGYFPEGMYDAHQLYLTAANPAALSGTTALPSVRANPNFDKNFKSKVDRSVATQTVRLNCSDIFPFLLTEKVVKGCKIEVNLNKQSNATLGAILFGALAATNLTLDMTRISLWMDRVKPSQKAMTMLETQIAKSPKVRIMYDSLEYQDVASKPASATSETWQIRGKVSKPKSVIVGFRYQDRLSDARLNPLQFDLASNVSRIDLRVNGRAIPNLAYEPNTKFERIVDDLHILGGKDRQLEDSPIVTYDNWQTMYPLYGFDCTHSEGNPYESRQESVLDLYWTMSSAPDASYNVCAVLTKEAECELDYSSGVTTVRKK